MLSISGPRRGVGSADYCLKQARDDYYSSGGESPGYWLGKGARQLALGCRVHDQVLKQLLIGMSPDGSRPMVQNAQQEDRQSAWDLTLNAPKPFSVLWGLAPPEIHETLERMHQHSVQVALDYGEESAGLTRRGKGGAIQERAALVFAVFQHGSSRALDPHLHSHCQLINLGVRADGTTGALKTEEIFRHKIRIGAFYREQLAFELTREFGVQIEAKKVGFRILGVPEALCRQFSKRRRMVEKKMQDEGRSGAIAAKIATLETRPAKIEVPQEELLRQWQEVGRRFGWSAEQVKTLLRGHPANNRLEPTEDGLPQAAPKTETATQPNPQEQRKDVRKSTIMAEEPSDAGRNAVRNDTPQTAPSDPSAIQNPAAASPGQPPAPSDLAKEESATAKELEKGLVSKNGGAVSGGNQSKGQAPEPTDLRNGAEESQKQASGQQLLPGMNQLEVPSLEAGEAIVGRTSQDRPTSTQPELTSSGDHVGNSPLTNQEGGPAVPGPNNYPESQPKPDGQPFDRLENQGAEGPRRDPATKAIKDQAARQSSDAASQGLPDDPRQQILTDSPAAVQLLLPMPSSADPSTVVEPQRGEGPPADPNAVPVSNNAATQVSSGQPAPQTPRQLVEAGCQNAAAHSSAQGSPYQASPHDPESPRSTRQYQSQPQTNQEPDERTEITPNGRSVPKRSPVREQNNSTSGGEREPVRELSPPNPQQSEAKKVTQAVEPQESPGTQAGQKGTRHQRRQSAEKNRRGAHGRRRPEAGPDNRQKSQRKGQQRHAKGQTERKSSSQGQQRNAERPSKQQSAAGPTGPEIAWYRAFPKAPFWSLASNIMVPGIALPLPKPRWGNVRWEKRFRFLRFSVETRLLFPDAPNWSPFRHLKHPAFRVTIPKEALPGPPRPRWWSIKWKKDLRWGELRIQERSMFRNAPQWSPLSRWKYRAVHLTSRKSKWTQEQQAKAEQRKAEQAKAQEYYH